jgi:nucleoside 2-deoxyribosyltransferase
MAYLPHEDRLFRPMMYLAGPLFSEAEKAFNRRVRDLLSPYFRVYLPQEDGILLVDAIEAGAGVHEAMKQIFAADTTAILASDLLIAILDGRTIDEGTAFEIGYAYAHRKPCYGLQTDPRRLLSVGNNPMIVQSLSSVFHSVEGLIDWARSQHPDGGSQVRLTDHTG